MPVLSHFYGISMRMYFIQAEHNPPHVHAIYGDHAAAIVIRTGEVLEGHLPPKALAMVREWVRANQEELLQIWDTQEFRALKPLE